MARYTLHNDFSILEEIYYKFVPVHDSFHLIPISEMFSHILRTKLTASVAEFDGLYNKKLTNKHDVLEYVLSFAMHYKLPLRLWGKNQTCAALKELVLIKRTCGDLIEMEYLDTPAVTVFEIREYQRLHPESVLAVQDYNSWQGVSQTKYFLKSDAFHDFRQWRANKNGQGKINLKDYVDGTTLSEWLGTKVHFSDFKAYKALYPDDVLFQKQYGYYKNGGVRPYLKRTARDDFATWHKNRTHQHRDNAALGREKSSIATKIMQFDDIDKAYRIQAETKQKSKQELEEIYLAQQQAELNKRIAHHQEIKRRHDAGLILSPEDLAQRFPGVTNIAELFAEYAQDSEYIIDGCYIPADKVSDFAFVMDLDDKNSVVFSVNTPNVQDFYTVSDAQMDRIATRLAGVHYISERAATQELLKQIAYEQNHNTER